MSKSSTRAYFHKYCVAMKYRWICKFLILSESLSLKVHSCSNSSFLNLINQFKDIKYSSEQQTMFTLPIECYIIPIAKSTYTYLHVIILLVKHNPDSNINLKWYNHVHINNYIFRSNRSSVYFNWLLHVPMLRI